MKRQTAINKLVQHLIDGEARGVSLLTDDSAISVINEIFDYVEQLEAELGKYIEAFKPLNTTAVSCLIDSSKAKDVSIKSLEKQLLETQAELASCKDKFAYASMVADSKSDQLASYKDNVVVEFEARTLDDNVLEIQRDIIIVVDGIDVDGDYKVTITEIKE